MGDWVEINGVSGEVVEIGPFHTVLLETGNWTDSGHPTGAARDVHQQFSRLKATILIFPPPGSGCGMSSRWYCPPGRTLSDRRSDPQKSGRGNARKRPAGGAGVAARGGFAGYEWIFRGARNQREAGAGRRGKCAVRYITRANERFNLRSKLNRAAVQLLGGKRRELAGAGIAANYSEPPWRRTSSLVNPYNGGVGTPSIER